MEEPAIRFEDLSNLAQGYRCRAQEKAVRAADQVEPRKRSEQKIAASPYYKLIQQNRDIVERTIVISYFGADDGIDDWYNRNEMESVRSGPVLVLGKLDDFNPVGKPILRKYQCSDGEGIFNRLTAEFIYGFINDVTLRKIQENPNQSRNVFVHTNIPIEQSYGMSVDTERRDELVERAYSRIQRTAINPVGGLVRAIEVRAIRSRLRQLDHSISLFEDAAADPELNPVLSELLLRDSETQA